MQLLECAVRNCARQPVVEDDGEYLCDRHMPDPHTRSWGEMRAEGIEIETMFEYAQEVRGFNDMDPPELDEDGFDNWEYDDERMS